MQTQTEQKPLTASDLLATPLDQIDMSQPNIFKQGLAMPLFERLRNEAPVHYCADSAYGPFWSVTKFNDIVEIEKNHQLFSSEPTVLLEDPPEDMPFQSFLQMDPPKHCEQRAAVQESVAPRNLMNLEPIIRERACKILDELPIGETFNWVDKVSVELTTQMLATLLDFPYEERHKITYWADITADINGGDLVTNEQRMAGLQECIEYFMRLWQERSADPSGPDLISMLIRSEATQDLITKPMEFLGMMLLLVTGGTETTRSSISGSVHALNQFPDEYQKLRDNPALIASMVPEAIRWQTPIMQMRRRANEDTVFRGQQIKKDDKLLLWYISGNRDEDVIETPNVFKVDRKNPRHQISFGFGVHRCMGNRMAEMQLRVMWEEIMKRFRMVELIGEPTRGRSMMVNGYTDMPVQVHPW